MDVREAPESFELDLESFDFDPITDFPARKRPDGVETLAK
jgi:hypothetical protein